MAEIWRGVPAGFLAGFLAGPVAGACGVGLAAQDPVVIGSKNFTESALLAELMAQRIEEHTELVVERRFGLGGTMICHESIVEGAIDIYPEYTGTAWASVLDESRKIESPLRAFFHVRREYRSRFDLDWLEPFGLNNSYALAVRPEVAERLGLQRISDLVEHGGELRAGFSIEFNRRDQDGWPGLRRAYGLELADVRVLEHALAYESIAAGGLDLIDAYTTDGKLLRQSLVVLLDDRRFFPPYNAAPVVRRDLLARHPEVADALGSLASRIPDRTAQALNYVVEEHREENAAVARAFLEREGLVEGVDPSAARAREWLARRLDGSTDGSPSDPAGTDSGWQPGQRLLRLVGEHLLLTVLAVVLAAAAAVPLGIWIVSRPRVRVIALSAAGVLQTIPSLALLMFMIPVFGLSPASAVAALFLYALLPILRNTYAGIAGVDGDLVDAARGMGLRPGQILWRVQLPLAMRTIMAGIRTAAVISIGVATLAAFIGAGGLGELIVEGLYTNDIGRMLLGAVPAAALAILLDLGLGRCERALQPRGVAG